jgi:hypothetical protein
MMGGPNHAPTMNDTLIDMAQSLAAVALCGPVVVLPGFALAGGAGVLGFWRRPASSQVQLALIAAFALLPGLDSLIVRLAGLTPALALNLALAVGGGVVLIKMGASFAGAPRRGWMPRAWTIGIGFALWVLIVGYADWDFDLGGRLYSSIIATDMVKHAATIQAIVDTGAPPIDPFFARATPSGYYYFFYTLGALVERLGLGLIDARAAFFGAAVWTGPAVFALAAELLTRSRYRSGDQVRRLRPILIALLLVSGLDILPICLMGASGQWAPTLGVWNEEVTPWLQSMLWVPHHVTSLIAIWAGLLALDAAIAPDGNEAAQRRLLICVIYAALAFVSALGASIWVTLAGVFTIALWLATLAWERRWRGVGIILAAGLFAVLLAAPHLHDLIANRQDRRFPIAVTIRAFKMFDLLVRARWQKAVGRAVLLPLNYGLEFGVMALGAILFLVRAKAGELWREATGVARLLILSAAAGLIMGTFLKSTIIYNDLGWRVMLFPQTTFLVWTCLALSRRIDRPLTRPGDRASAMAWSSLFLVGYLTTLYSLFGLRFYRALPTPGPPPSAADPAIHRQLREAYIWLGQHTPPSDVVQQRPGPHRVFEFGLYGRNRVGVADNEAMLFGASQPAVKARLAQLEPIFTSQMPAREAANRARSQGVNILIAKSTDPAWAARGSWVWATPPLYSSPMVRVVTVQSLAATAAR